MPVTVTHSRGAYEVAEATPAVVFKAWGEGYWVTDANLARHYAAELKSLPHLLVHPAGEATKSMDALGRTLDWLAEEGATRKSTVVAFGGGVVGDLAGFAAAVYMRGVDAVQIPTSLLAMVDSSVGGKVGIDLPSGKNLAGAFWPPSRVELATEFLTTLPAREWLCGAAEVWKYGAILDPDLLGRLEAEPLAPDRPCEDVVWRCVRLKADVVAADEHETLGYRAALNFGHTIGHAIEAELEYQGLTHGEAVAIGMVAEAKVGERIGLTPAGTTDRLQAGLQAQGLPTEVPAGLSPERLVERMRRDKKKATGPHLAFSLLTRVGECRLVTDVPESDVLSVLKGP